MASATDVPGKYDVVIDGHGYVFLDALTPNIPFRTHRATYSYSPTFVERQNVSNQYGDNAQDFFLTIRQRDWSLGEQQKFFRSGQDGRYWQGAAIDVRTPGQASMRRAVKSLTFASAPKVALQYGTGTTAIFTTTNLYILSQDGTITDQGAHGLGRDPTGAAALSSQVYFSAGGAKVRVWDGAAFADFSGTGSDELCYLNNTLYGLDATDALRQYDTAGTMTTIYQFKRPDGSLALANLAKIAPYGGKLLILRTSAGGSELWIYDGVGVSILAKMPPSFFASRMVINYGIVFISGIFVEKDDGTTRTDRPGIYFFDGGSLGLLWQSSDTMSTASSKDEESVSPALGAYGAGVVFTDDSTGSFMFYNPASGGVSSIGAYSAGATNTPLIASCQRFFLHTRNQTGAWMFPDSSTVATSSTVTSSLIDFESSLPKQFRTIKVEFSAATDGNGGSVDIAYQVDSLAGSWTTLQTGAVSGTEYTLSNVSGHAIAVKVTLNKGTSTLGPVLRALSIRGTPQLQTFRKRSYIIDLTGAGPDAPRRLRDGTPDSTEPFDGVTNLIAAATATAPISITDRFGTFNGIIEPDGFEIAEMHAQMTRPAKSGSFVVTVNVREV